MTASAIAIPASDRPDPRAARVSAIVFVTVFLDLVGFGIVIPFLPLDVESMGGNAVTVGFLFSMFSLTQLIATPILGRMSDRYGRRRVVVLSLAGNTASMVLFAAADGMKMLPLLFVSRILAGATAGNLAACQAAVADVTRGEARAKGMGRIGAAIGLGMVMGPAIGGWASRLGSSAPPLFAAALAGLDLIAALFLLPETHPPAPAPEGLEAKGGAPYRAAPAPATRALGSLLSEPAIRLVFVLYFLTFLYMTTLQVALPLLARDRLGWGSPEIGHVFVMFGLVGLVVQGFLIGRLTRALGPRNLVVIGSISAGSGLLTIAAGHTPVAILGGLALLGVGLGVTTPILSTLASDRAGPARQGVVLGFAQSSGGLARTLGPLGSGALYSRFGPGAAFIGGAVAALCALVLSLGPLSKPVPPPPRPPEP